MPYHLPWVGTEASGLPGGRNREGCQDKFYWSDRGCEIQSKIHLHLVQGYGEGGWGGEESGAKWHRESQELRQYNVHFTK